MTQEQDAANWKFLEQYKQLKTERAKREALAQNWGFAFASTGEALSACGGILPSLDLANFPERTAMLEAQRELRVLNSQIADLREKLRRAGMGDLT